MSLIYRSEVVFIITPTNKKIRISTILFLCYWLYNTTLILENEKNMFYDDKTTFNFCILTIRKINIDKFSDKIKNNAFVYCVYLLNLLDVIFCLF